MGMKVKRTAPFCMGFNGIMVKPGLNTFNDVESKVLSVHPIFKEQCDLGNQKVLDDQVKDSSMAEVILGLSANKAIKEIGDVLDIDVLKTLAERETRASVLKAVEKQIAMLKDVGDDK